MRDKLCYCGRIPSSDDFHMEDYNIHICLVARNRTKIHRLHPYSEHQLMETITFFDIGENGCQY